METLLEYLNRSSRKSLDYGPVQLHYSKGKPDGVEIQDGKIHFIFSLKDLEEMYWEQAMDKVASIGQRLPDQEEWMLVDKYRDQINHLLESVGGDTISNKYYWSSERRNNTVVWIWIYDGGKGTITYYDKYFPLTVRTIKDT